MESAGEMALATKARRKANLHQTRSFIAEQLFCPFDATFKDILIRCKAQAFLEHSYEMVRAEFCYVRQLANRHCSPYVCFHVLSDSSRVVVRQAPSWKAFCTRRSRGVPAQKHRSHVDRERLDVETICAAPEAYLPTKFSADVPKFAITKKETIDRVNPVFRIERIWQDNQIESVTSVIPGPLAPGAPWHERHIPVQHVAHKRTLVSNLLQCLHRR